MDFAIEFVAMSTLIVLGIMYFWPQRKMTDEELWDVYCKCHRSWGDYEE